METKNKLIVQSDSNVVKPHFIRKYPNIELHKIKSDKLIIKQFDWLMNNNEENNDIIEILEELNNSVQININLNKEEIKYDLITKEILSILNEK